MRAYLVNGLMVYFERARGCGVHFGTGFCTSLPLRSHDGLPVCAVWPSRHARRSGRTAARPNPFPKRARRVVNYGSTAHIDRLFHETDRQRWSSLLDMAANVRHLS